MIAVPEDFAASTVTREGEAGRTWIDGLPSLVRELCERWELSLDGSPLHGYVALVVPVTRQGVELVLKVSWMDRETEHEALALSTWDGQGAVRLVESGEEGAAMLLERLAAERTLERVPVDESVQIAGALLRRLAVPAPPELRRLADEVPRLRSTLLARWEGTGRPFERRLLERVLELLDEAAASSVATIVNIDLHPGNVLAGTREPWLVIDPKVLAGEVEFGVAQLLWSRFEEMRGSADLDRRLAILVDVAELDPELARSWSLVRVVEYWLWALDLGFTQDPQRCSELVGWLAPEFAP